MALRGNLRDFSLPDVFQLVTFSKKTGILRIKRADGTDGSVWFRDGEVFFAQSNWHGEPLGERLVHANRITPSALSKALDMRAKEAEGGRRLGEILVEEGYITDKVLEAFVQEQIQDTIFDLMRWDEGEFDFELLPDVVDEDIGLSVSIENVIMEGSRRLEEWTRIKKKIPSMDIVFKMATAPGEGTFEISLKPIEWNLLLLVDGTRSVAELATETNRTDFEVARIMYGLFSAGLLEVATDEEVERLRAERVEREALLAEIRAEQAATEAEAVRETQEREAALEAQAEDRAKADAAAEAVAEAAEAAALVAAEAEQPVGIADLADRPEPEVPEFLVGDGSQAASADDMAVFAEMMGAVLEAPEDAIDVALEPEPLAEPLAEETTVVPAVAEVTEAPEVLEAPEVTAAPDVPVAAAPEESAEAAPAAEAPYVAPEESEFALDLDSVPQPTVEPALDLEPSAVYEFDFTAGGDEVPTASATGDDTDSALGALESLRAELAEEPQPVTPTGDLERDLMALGLGELPAQDFFETSADEFVVAPVEEQVSSEEADEPEPFADLASLTEALGEAPDVSISIEQPVSGDIVIGVESVDEPSTAIPDLSDILESLDTQAGLDDEVEVVETPALDDSAVEPAPSMGVISTDAFLADIAGESLGVGLSSGLGDELSALTGAGGNKRPTASVNKIPDAGSPIEIHRDHTVDKDLVLKIIEGIKGL